MDETLFFLNDLIRIDIFVGFGFYSIIYFSLRLIFKENTFLAKFDKSAVQVIIYGGFLWLCLWLIGTFVYYHGLKSGIEKREYLELVFGKYSYGIWVQPIFWFLLTQLYRIRMIGRFLIPRVIISLLFVLTFEQFVIIVTSLHRDYPPNNWTLGFNVTLDPHWILLGLISKILMFIFIVVLYHFGLKKITTLFNKIYR